MDVSQSLSLGMSASPQDPGRIVIFADSLIGSSDERARRVLSDLAFGWVQQAPDQALAWIEANSAELDSLFLGNAARGLAQRDATRAASFLDRLPAEQRGEWFAVVAEPYARAYPREALNWVARYQGQPGYAAALRAVVTRIAPGDPQSAAALVVLADVETQASVAPAVASAWAGRDPAAAAQWAQNLGDSRARSGALDSALSAWAERDLDAASRFTRNMPRGAARDEALALLLSRGAGAGSIDRAMLNDFSSDVARQSLLVGLMPGIARRDPADARSLLDDYISDAALREQAEVYIRVAETTR